ncbi:MAG: hypothetical protein MZV63_00660 [Marinilabiliales bacterium]|nr:hypothetical protein [Marinilabiliales bacterium]
MAHGFLQSFDENLTVRSGGRSRHQRSIPRLLK